jgi:hypothetical protein
MDASYGTNTALRTGIDALGLTYVAAILPTVKVRAAKNPQLRVSVKELALSLPKHDWRTITWREGSAAPLRSRFARLRVRIAPARGAAGRPEETLLVEWPEGEAAPTKYWLSNLGNKISFRALVDIAKMRWRIERDYQDLKQEIGLGHYEGRGWRGFHHHGTLCIAAYGFLVSERETIPPSAPRCSRRFAKPAISGRYRPRGAAAPAPTARPQFDRHRAPNVDRRDRCHDAHAAPAPLHGIHVSIYDTVRLRPCGRGSKPPTSPPARCSGQSAKAAELALTGWPITPWSGSSASARRVGLDPGLFAGHSLRVRPEDNVKLHTKI